MKSKIEEKTDKKLWSLAGKKGSWWRVLVIAAIVFASGCFVGWLL